MRINQVKKAVDIAAENRAEIVRNPGKDKNPNAQIAGARCDNCLYCGIVYDKYTGEIKYGECHFMRPGVSGFNVIRCSDFCSYHHDAETGKRTFELEFRPNFSAVINHENA